MQGYIVLQEGQHIPDGVCSEGRLEARVNLAVQLLCTWIESSERKLSVGEGEEGLGVMSRVNHQRGQKVVAIQVK